MNKKKVLALSSLVLLIILGSLCFIIIVAFWIFRTNLFAAGNNSQLNNSASEKPLPLSSVVMVERLAFAEVKEIGNGIIISADGLILTNAELVLPKFDEGEVEYRIGISTEEGKIPHPTFYATLYQADPFINLAILKIITDIKGNPLNASELNLPYIELNTNEDLALGSQMKLIGYTNVIPMEFYLTQCSLSGYAKDSLPNSILEENAVIKTNLIIQKPINGGAVLDDKNRLIGLPLFDYHPVASKQCRQTFQGINVCSDNTFQNTLESIRPLRYAIPLINAAKAGEVKMGVLYLGKLKNIQRETIQFKDDFSVVSNKWFVPNEMCDEFCMAEHFQNQSLLMQSFSAYAYQMMMLDQIYKNTIVTVQAVRLSENLRGNIGIICRYQDNANYYTLEVSAEGWVSIRRKNKGEWFTPTVFYYPDMVVPRQVEPIKISAACVDNLLSLSVNEQVVFAVEDNTFYEGRVGVLSSSWNGENFAFLFDDFVLETAHIVLK